MGNVKASKLGMLLRGALGMKPRPTQPTPEWVRLVDSEEEGAEVRRNRSRVAPEGCFSVYVGPKRTRFVVRAELANHPLFRLLLDEAESEYGFCSEGPLALPCDVDLFHHVLGEMDSEATAGLVAARPMCAFCPGGLNPYHLLSPSRFRVQ
uniref:Uncharacterized protein n=2 Tax=Nymphaea colorata TaxID=210225 RepID=A0A5K1AIK8_9MAGN